MGMRRSIVVVVVVLGVLLSACGSSGSNKAQPPTGTGGGGTTPAPQQLGQGVTNDTVKIGVALVDFSCIRQYAPSIRENQDQIYNTYINNINQNGGVAGRKIVPVYHTFCPIGSSQAVNLCTKFGEDDKVFMVIGNLVDFSGDAQTCVAKKEKMPLITFQLTQKIMDQSPPGMILLPGVTSERSARILFQLIQQNPDLIKGKKIGILGETVSKNTVTSTIEPGLKALGVQTGSTGILNVTGTDTAAAQAQLDSLIQRWKGEGTNALFVTGTQVSSQQFIEKVRAAMPGVLLMSDDTETDSYGQAEHKAGRVPNPYEGIIVPTGPTAHEYDNSANWKFCQAIWEKQNHQVPPNAETVLKTPDGKALDTYGGINDACQIMSMISDIGNRIGKNLNDTTWVNTVNTYGKIANRGSGEFASLHQGKYDVQDSFRLSAFDSSIPPDGDWKPITQLQDITGDVTTPTTTP
jgi:hypothetical protein